jgi:hypothetical protein
MQVVEDLSRKPRIPMAWALTDPFPGTIEALSLGAVLMTIYTDGLVGMSVDAEFIEDPRGGLFVMTVTMPHALDPLEASNNAEVVYRNLVQGAASSDVIVSTFHALDRVFLQTLTSTHALSAEPVISLASSGTTKPTATRAGKPTCWARRAAATEYCSASPIMSLSVSSDVIR